MQSIFTFPVRRQNPSPNKILEFTTKVLLFYFYLSFGREEHKYSKMELRRCDNKIREFDLNKYFNICADNEKTT